MIERIARQWLFIFMIVLCHYCFSGLSLAAEESLELFLERIQESSDKVESFSCGFSQEKKMALFASPVSFQGKLYIDRPEKLRWEFVSPVPSALLFNGDEGARCDDQMILEKFNLATDPVMKMVAMQLWMWLGGDYKQLDRLYKLEKQGQATLVVTPVNSETSEYISSVRIFFGKHEFQPEKVEITEPGGDLTTIIFNNPVINAKLPVALFTDCRRNE